VGKSKNNHKKVHKFVDFVQKGEANYDEKFI